MNKPYGLIDSELRIAQTRRAQVKEFDFKNKACSVRSVQYCGSKHPDRWNRVVQCERKDLAGAEPFKDVLLHYCRCRNAACSMKAVLRCNGVHNLAAAEAQFSDKGSSRNVCAWRPDLVCLTMTANKTGR